ncbi:MAG TPA: hypothetical protein VLE99_04140 [Candidatus Saccharimonadales bacterium]|nr:hypothetical protein [Candidatus Saccharimonadales bacterium]
MHKKLLLLLAIEAVFVFTAQFIFFKATHGYQTCHTAVTGCGTGRAVNLVVDVGALAGALVVITLPATVISWLLSKRAKRDR